MKGLLESIKEEIYLPEINYRDVANILHTQDSTKFFTLITNIDNSLTSMSRVIEKLTQRVEELEMLHKK